MTRVAIIADSHIPSRAGRIPDWVTDRVASADHLVHAGDFDSTDAYETVVAMGPDLTAVHGNMDPDSLELPTVNTLDVDDTRFVVTHGTGSPRGWTDRVVETAHEHAGEDAQTVAVAGHTHEVVDESVGGVRLLNPGSVTGARPASEATMLTVDVDGADLDVTVHRE